MSLDPEFDEEFEDELEGGMAVSAVSAHVRYPSQESVTGALLRLGVVRGAPVAVWPPRRLPYGVFVSPPRNGWVSLWNPLGNTRDWFPQLTATLECPGIVLEVIEGTFWLADFFHDARFVGRVELPTEAIEEDLLRARAIEALQIEGVQEPWEDDERLADRMESLEQDPEVREELLQLREERPELEDLRPFLPPHADLERAWDLLTAIDMHSIGREEQEPSLAAEDYMDRFAVYLGIRDSTWDPEADSEALAEGDYEDEEGLPDEWQGFVVMAVPQLRVL